MGVRRVGWVRGAKGAKPPFEPAWLCWVLWWTSTRKLRMNTANGVSAVSPVVLGRVTLGSIDMNDVEAVVMPPGTGTADLLGASFLKRLASVEQRNGMLVLRQ